MGAEVHQMVLMDAWWGLWKESKLEKRETRQYRLMRMQQTEVGSALQSTLL
jgi:hypothetical protein